MLPGDVLVVASGMMLVGLAVAVAAADVAADSAVVILLVVAVVLEAVVVLAEAAVLESVVLLATDVDGGTWSHRFTRPSYTAASKKDWSPQKSTFAPRTKSTKPPGGMHIEWFMAAVSPGPKSGSSETLPPRTKTAGCTEDCVATSARKRPVTRMDIGCAPRYCQRITT